MFLTSFTFMSLFFLSMYLPCPSFIAVFTSLPSFCWSFCNFKRSSLVVALVFWVFQFNIFPSLSLPLLLCSIWAHHLLILNLFFSLVFLLFLHLSMYPAWVQSLFLFIVPFTFLVFFPTICSILFSFCVCSNISFLSRPLLLLLTKFAKSCSHEELICLNWKRKPDTSLDEETQTFKKKLLSAKSN